MLCCRSGKGRVVFLQTNLGFSPHPCCCGRRRSLLWAPAGCVTRPEDLGSQPVNTWVRSQRLLEKSWLGDACIAERSLKPHQFSSFDFSASQITASGFLSLLGGSVSHGPLAGAEPGSARCLWPPDSPGIQRATRSGAAAPRCLQTEARGDAQFSWVQAQVFVIGVYETK